MLQTQSNTKQQSGGKMRIVFFKKAFPYTNKTCESVSIKGESILQTHEMYSSLGL